MHTGIMYLTIDTGSFPRLVFSQPFGSETYQKIPFLTLSYMKHMIVDKKILLILITSHKQQVDTWKTYQGHSLLTLQYSDLFPPTLDNFHLQIPSFFLLILCVAST